MSKTVTTEILPENLLEHRAVKAWSQLEPERTEPEAIAVLRLTRKKSAVYRMAGVGPTGAAVVAKRCRTTTAIVERLIYEEVLSSLSLPALGCYGFVPEPGGEFCWLFLEDAGTHEYSPENAEHRALAGRWLGAVHRVARVAGLQARLPDRGLSHYLQRLRTSRAELLQRVGNPVLSAADVAVLQTVVTQFDMIEAHWAEVERFSDSLPPTLVHGDFVIRNLRIRPGANGLALLVYDWEMAGWGFPATDLAQVDRCARADLDAYYSAARQDFPQLDFSDIQWLANYGNLLRVVDAIYWATLFMVRETYKSLLKPLRMIGKYETQLAASLHAVNWNATAGWKRATRARLTPPPAQTN